MTEQKDAEQYRAMRKMAEGRGFKGVAEAILAASEEKRRADMAEADNAVLVTTLGLVTPAHDTGWKRSAHEDGCRKLSDETEDCECDGDEILASVHAAKTKPHPGASLLAEVVTLRAQSVPVTEDDLAVLERLLASASQGDVWAWLEKARALFPSMAAELRTKRAASRASNARRPECRCGQQDCPTCFPPDSLAEGMDDTETEDKS